MAVLVGSLIRAAAPVVGRALLGRAAGAAATEGAEAAAGAAARQGAKTGIGRAIAREAGEYVGYTAAQEVGGNVAQDFGKGAVKGAVDTVMSDPTALTPTRLPQLMVHAVTSGIGSAIRGAPSAVAEGVKSTPGALVENGPPVILPRVPLKGVPRGRVPTPKGPEHPGPHPNAKGTPESPSVKNPKTPKSPEAGGAKPKSKFKIRDVNRPSGGDVASSGTPGPSGMPSLLDGAFRQGGLEARGGFTPRAVGAATHRFLPQTYTQQDTPAVGQPGREPFLFADDNRRNTRSSLLKPPTAIGHY